MMLRDCIDKDKLNKDKDRAKNKQKEIRVRERDKKGQIFQKQRSKEIISRNKKDMKTRPDENLTN